MLPGQPSASIRARPRNLILPQVHSSSALRHAPLEPPCPRCQFVSDSNGNPQLMFAVVARSVNEIAGPGVKLPTTRMSRATDLPPLCFGFLSHKPNTPLQPRRVQ